MELDSRLLKRKKARKHKSCDSTNTLLVLLNQTKHCTLLQCWGKFILTRIQYAIIWWTCRANFVPVRFENLIISDQNIYFLVKDRNYDKQLSLSSSLSFDFILVKNNWEYLILQHFVLYVFYTAAWIYTLSNLFHGFLIIYIE